MGFANFKAMRDTFDRLAYSPAVFPAFRKAFSMTRQFNAAVGIISRFAISPEVLFPQLKDVLLNGRMHPMNAAAFMCVNSNRHDQSKFDTPNFLKNFLDLYSATTWEECCEIEHIEKDSDDYVHIQNIGQEIDRLTHNKDISKEDLKEAKRVSAQKLEDIKIFCWVRDLERATKPNFFRSALFGSREVSRAEAFAVLDSYDKNAADALDDQDKQNKKINPDTKVDVTALPKEKYLKLLRQAMHKGDISHTQCAIMLMFILHAREKRNSGESYIKHPVTVSKLVEAFGAKYLGNDDGHVWMACMAALLHDGGEKTDIDMEKDLSGLLPAEVIEAVRCLHKKDGEAYFEYLERCTNNRLAAVVKLCDIYHNSSDMGNVPNAKQAFVYPLSANYVEYRLRHPDEVLSVAAYCAQEKICDPAEFAEIHSIAESGENKSAKDSQNAAKKRPASDFPHLQIVMGKVKSVKEILLRAYTDYANTRGEENLTLQP